MLCNKINSLKNAYCFLFPFEKSPGGFQECHRWKRHFSAPGICFSFLCLLNVQYFYRWLIRDTWPGRVKIMRQESQLLEKLKDGCAHHSGSFAFGPQGQNPDAGGTGNYFFLEVNEIQVAMPWASCFPGHKSPHTCLSHRGSFSHSKEMLRLFLYSRGEKMVIGNP